MIVDAEALRPRQRDREPARGRRRRATIKPELMESVLEIATDPCADTARGRRASCARCARRSRRPPRERGLTIGSAGTHPFAMWEDQRIVARDALPRPRLRAALRRPPGADLRRCTCTSASTTPTRRSTSPTGCASTSRCCWRCRPTRRSGAPTRPGLHSTRTPIFRAFPRVGVPPRYRDWEDFSDADRLHGRQRRDRGLHLPLVRRPPAPEVRHGRDARCATRRRASSTRSALAALIQAMVKELVRALRRRQAALATTRGRCSTRTSGSPPATASTASSSTCRPPRRSPPRRSRAGCSTACASTPQDLGSAARARRASRTCWSAAPARARQMLVYEANHDLREVMGEIVGATREGLDAGCVALARRRAPARRARGPARRARARSTIERQ